MKTTTATLQKPRSAALQAWRPLLAALWMAAAGTAAWAGGWLGVLGAVAAPGALALFLWRPAADDAHAGTGSTGSPAGAPPAEAGRIAVNTVLPTGGGQRQGAEVMVAQVVPVWSRQLEVTRDAASDGLAAILQTFAELSGNLQTLSANLSNFSVSASPGSVDSAVRAESPALRELTAASSRAFAERDAAVAVLAECADGLVELQHLAKQSRELARHTRLVAFNASIESNRLLSGAGGGGGGGNGGASSADKRSELGGTQAVASELRMLSGRIAETAESIERVVNSLSGQVRKACRVGEVADTSPEELQLEIDISARRALAALLAALGTSMQSSTEVKQTAESLNAQIEAAYMHFQFGDRVSQMLTIVATDMSNFARWVADHPRASQTDAAAWLAALEASYTMEEQRSSHHGNVHVDAGAAVEFF